MKLASPGMMWSCVNLLTCVENMRAASAFSVDFMKPASTFFRYRPQKGPKVGQNNVSTQLLTVWIRRELERVAGKAYVPIQTLDHDL